MRLLCGEDGVARGLKSRAWPSDGAEGWISSAVLQGRGPQRQILSQFLLKMQADADKIAVLSHGVDSSA